MNKKLIIWTVLLLGLFGLIIWWGSKQPPVDSHSQNNSQVSAKSSLIVSESLYDFGTISMKNGKVEKVFTITNPTDKDITIEEIGTSCMCTVAYIQTTNGEMGPFGMPGHGGPSIKADVVIKPGEVKNLRVVFDPNAHGPAGVGVIERVVHMHEKSGAGLEVGFKAVVQP